MINNFIVIVILCCTVVFVQAADVPEKAPGVSASVGSLYYQLGGGKVLPPPGANYATFRINARFKGGFGYSCGKFNFQQNIEQMVNQIRTQARQLPGQLTMAAQAAVSGLPGYFLQKRNPTLYNIITKTLDESSELFKLSYKTCEAMEREMAKNPDADPYSGFLRASIADRWKSGEETGAVAADIHQNIKNEPGEPIRWIGGRRYGSASNPIQINKDIVTAGYNIMIGRTGDVSVLTAPTSNAMRNLPIVRIWPTPEFAGRWAQDVIGDKRIVLGNNADVPQSVVGHGLRPKVLELERETGIAIEAALRGDFSAINQYQTTRLSNKLITALKQIPLDERIIMTDRLTSEIAVAETQERLFLIKQMMLIGLKAPDVSASTGGAIAEKYIRDSTFSDINEAIADMHNDLELKQRTINKTALLILDRAARNKRRAVGARPGVIITGDGSIKGAVKSIQPIEGQP